jgi:hypothetical protein
MCLGPSKTARSVHVSIQCSHGASPTDLCLEWAKKTPRATSRPARGVSSRGALETETLKDRQDLVHQSCDLVQGSATIEEVGDCTQKVTEEPATRYGCDVQLDRSTCTTRPRRLRSSGPRVRCRMSHDACGICGVQWGLHSAAAMTWHERVPTGRTDVAPGSGRGLTRRFSRAQADRRAPLCARSGTKPAWYSSRRRSTSAAA